jgi:hypothetical protein
MRLLFLRGAWLLLGLLCVVPACSSDANIKPISGVGGIGGSGGAGGSTGGSTGLVGCLDQPGALDRPPGAQLPCELVPPGLKL